MTAASSVPVAQGDVVAGKYVVERVLGTGGMGIVVAARHEQLEQLVAIKLMRDDAVGNDDAVARFLREARAAAKLRSEHVARVLDVGTLESGAPYMVMEYLEGSDLAQVLASRGPMSIEETVRLLLQACEAVAEAHAAGIIHRDLKPQNLFLAHAVDGSPKLKVLDFGISKAIGQANVGHGANLTGTRVMLGSPYYMAPEQMMSSRDVDERVDIWALGIVLFELLTGRCPFEADTMPGLCHKVVNDPPPPVSELRADVPRGLAAIIERCLMKDPAHRFACAGDLAAALTRFSHLPKRHVRDLVHVPEVGNVSGSSRSRPGAHVESTPRAWNSRSRPASSRRRAPRTVWTLASVLAATTLLLGVGIRRREHLGESLPTRDTVAASSALEASPLGLQSAPADHSAPVPVASVSTLAPSPPSQTPPVLSSKPLPRPAEPRRASVATAVSTRAVASAKPADAPAASAIHPVIEGDGIPTRR